MITKELKRGKKHQEELGILLVGQLKTKTAVTYLMAVYLF